MYDSSRHQVFILHRSLLRWKTYTWCGLLSIGEWQQSTSVPSCIAILLPLEVIVKGPPPLFVVHIQFNMLYQFWIHTEVIDTQVSHFAAKDWNYWLKLYPEQFVSSDWYLIVFSFVRFLCSFWIVINCYFIIMLFIFVQHLFFIISFKTVDWQ